jgi:hypothetical protein
MMRSLLLGLLAVTAIAAGDVLFTEGFDGAWTPNSPPTGWRIFHTNPATWEADDWHRDTAHAPWGDHPSAFASIYYVYNGDATPDSLISPLIDCRGFQNVVFECSTYFWRWSNSNYTAKLMYSVDGGVTFPYTLHDYYQSSVNAPVFETFDLTAAANRESVVVAWVFSGNLAYINCWYLDDVRVTGDAMPRWDMQCRRIIAPTGSMLPDTLRPIIRYRNLGLLYQDTVVVACSLYDNLFNGLAYWHDTIFDIPAGSAERETMFYPGYYLGTGNYVFRAWCAADSDDVRGNDTLTRYFSVRNTRTYGWDNGSPASYHDWPLGHYGWGTRFTLDTFPVYFESLRVYLRTPADPNHCRYQLALFNDDGAGSPGEMFWLSPVQYAAPNTNAWRSVFLADSGEKMVRTPASGTFYLFYLQVGEAPEAPSLGRDASRASGASYWEYRNGAFVPNYDQGDYMLRAVMNLDPATSALLDVRVSHVQSPEYDFVQRPFDAPVNPAGRVENSGTTTAYAVLTRCGIYDASAVQLYDAQVLIDSLSPGESRYVQFPEWRPVAAGRCSVFLTATATGGTGDSIPENDDKRFSCDVIKGRHTGTSAFGYAWVDSDTTNGPVYRWIDTTECTNRIALGPNGRMNIPTYFPFSFYDSTYNYVYVSANGWMSIGSSDPGGAGFDTLPLPLPDPTAPNGVIYPYWDNLAMGPEYGRGLVWVGYGGTTPNRYCVIIWSDLAREGAADTSDRVSFQVVINENSTFQVQYQDVSAGDLAFDNGRGATVGVEGPNGADGLTYLYARPPQSGAMNDPGNRLAPGRAVMFYRELRDVASLRIVRPAGYMFRGPILPEVKVQNYGTVRDTFRVHVRIGNVYTTDTLLSGLAPGESTTVSFTQPWFAELGTYTVVCSVAMAGDTLYANDKVSGIVYITPWGQRENIPLGTRRRKVKSGSLVRNVLDGHLYAMKGSNTNEFWRYRIADDEWESLPSMPTTPSNTKAKDGCDLAFDPNHGVAGRIWAIKGGNRPDFYYFDVETNTWHQARSAILNDPTGRRSYKPPKKGAGIAYVPPGPRGSGTDGSVFCMPGNASLQFWRYDIARDSWSYCLDDRGEIIDIPRHPLKYVTVKAGGDMVFDGMQKLYITKGAATAEVYGLDVDTMRWTDTLDDRTLIGPTGRTVKAGGAIGYHQGRVYVLKGGNTREFWGYRLADDSWVRRSDIPFAATGRRVKVKRGAAMAAADSTLFVLKGSYGFEFWEYKPSGDTVEPGFFATRPGHDGIMAEAGLDARAWITAAPNPTRAGLLVQYNLPGAAPVRVRVYDPSGRLVANLADSRRAAGRHALRWDGLKPDGNRVAAGIYFVTLETDGARLSRKFVVER